MLQPFLFGGGLFANFVSFLRKGGSFQKRFHYSSGNLHTHRHIDSFGIQNFTSCPQASYPSSQIYRVVGGDTQHGGKHQGELNLGKNK